MKNQTIDSIRKIKQLPPPSGLSREILRIVSDDQVDLIDLVSIINKSPAITARILRCANSAYYGQRGEIATVREAIIRVLGLGITRSLALAMALSSSFNVNKSSNFNAERYWFNAVTTASIAQGLSPYLRVRTRPAPATAYTTGLIYNLGLQALVHCFPQPMDEIFSQTQGSLGERTEAVLGISHHQVSALLSQSWDLPQAITQALQSINGSKSFDENCPLVHLIWLSSQLSDLLYCKKAITIAEFHISEEMINEEHIQRVLSEIEEQLEGLHEIAQLITGNREPA